MIQKLIEKQVENRPWISFGILCCCLGILVAFLIYSSNAPKDIHKEIPVTYLVNLNTMELPLGLRFDSEIASYSYDNARCILKNFKDKNLENTQKIKQMLQANPKFNIACFQDLTEYLIPYNMGLGPSGTEMELALYRGESTKLLAWPHSAIRGESKPLDRIEGKFKNNIFYGIEAFPELHRNIAIRLPKNTKMALIKTNKAPPVFIIKNKFLEIKIEIWYLFASSGYYAECLPDSAFRQSGEPILKEQKCPIKRYDTVISYNVTFNRLRYGFPEMQYYEEWANDLLLMLQRNFLWGSPTYLNPTE